jgi:hypothetical protein
VAVAEAGGSVRLDPVIGETGAFAVELVLGEAQLGDLAEAELGGGVVDLLEVAVGEVGHGFLSVAVLA